MEKRVLISLILLFNVAIISNSFIIEAHQGLKKCFKAQHSPDKTLQVKFGFPRRQRENCDVHFSVNLISQNEGTTSIYGDVHKCHEMNPGQPHVIKHTTQSATIDGHYEICFDVMQDNNEQLLIQIFIGEKINPLLYSDGEDVLPLIQSSELIDLDLKIQNIRKSLGWSRKLLDESKDMGDRLQAGLGQLNEFSINATLFQIAFLVMYGIVWILFMKQQKVN